MSVSLILLQPFFGCQAQFVIPSLPESSDEWLFQKFIYPDLVFPTQYFCAFAYLPPVIVNSGKPSVVGKPDRVEAAADRFEKLAVSFPAQFFKSAETFSSGRVAGEDAVFAVDDTRHQISLFIYIRHSLLPRHLLRRRGHIRHDFRKKFLQPFVFLFCKGGAGVSLYAAFPETFVEVAFEKFLNHVE